MNKKIILSLSVIGIAAAIAIGGTVAYFSSIQTSTGNTLTAGTLKIDANNNGGNGTFGIVFGDVGHMAPGDITPWVKVQVWNSGSIDAATFGTFTLANASTPDLSKMLKFYDYRVEYFKADNSLVARWGAGHDNYYGTLINEDWFIKDGDTTRWTAVGGKTNLYDWVTTNGVLDEANGSWDEEGVKAGGYYVLSFRLQMDPTADNTYQGKTVTVGYQVKATQLNTAAILGLNLGGPLSDANTVANTVVYLTSQIPFYNY